MIVTEKHGQFFLTNLLVKRFSDFDDEKCQINSFIENGTSKNVDEDINTNHRQPTNKKFEDQKTFKFMFDAECKFKT